MKFAHFADVHIGVWRDPRLRDVSCELFLEALDQCIQEQVDFILLSGDLFNTSMPSIDHLRHVVQGLRKVKRANITTYYIAGSHDFSSSGKTMLDVLQAADLATNIARGEEVNGKLRLQFFTEPKTGVKLAGMVGKKGGLETAYYDNLDYAHLESEPGPKIFLFHSAIEEMKPTFLEQMPAAPLSILPKGFDYYAGGHVHVVEAMEFPDHPRVVFPGPLFPCSFSELERLQQGGYYLVEDGKATYRPLARYPVVNLRYQLDEQTPAQAEETILQDLQNRNLQNSIVTLRLKGVLQGKVADLNNRTIVEACRAQGASVVLKNTYDLRSADLDVVHVATGSIEDVEERLIKENTGQSIFGAEEEQALITQLMDAFAAEKDEGETKTGFEERVRKDADSLLQ